jgi:hypothetical protein
MESVKHAARPKQWTDAEKQQLARLAKQGSDASEISAHLGRHISSVRQMARKMKLVLRRRKKREEAAN